MTMAIQQPAARGPSTARRVSVEPPPLVIRLTGVSWYSVLRRDVDQQPADMAAREHLLHRARERLDARLVLLVAQQVTPRVVPEDANDRHRNRAEELHDVVPHHRGTFFGELEAFG